MPTTGPDAAAVVRARLPIEAERVILRGLRQADAVRISALAGDWEVARRTARMPHPYPVDRAETWISSSAAAFDAGEEITFAVTRRPDGAFIGCCGIVLFSGEDGTYGELGYWIGRDYWGEGIGSEIVRILIETGFRDLELPRLVAEAQTDNSASIRILEKAGFHPVARVHRPSRAHGGAEQDVVRLACTPYHAQAANER